VPACRYNDDMELEDAVHTAILTLKEGFEGIVFSKLNIDLSFYLNPGQLTERNIEIGIIGGDDKTTFRKLSEAEIKDYLANIS